MPIDLRHGVDQLGWNLVVEEGLTRQDGFTARVRRTGGVASEATGRERIIDLRDGLPRGIESQVAVKHGRGGHSAEAARLPAELKPFVVEEPEALFAAVVNLGQVDGATQGPAEIVHTESWFLGI